MGTEKAQNYRFWQLLIKAPQNIRYNCLDFGPPSRSRYELIGYMRLVEILVPKHALFFETRFLRYPLWRSFSSHNRAQRGYFCTKQEPEGPF